MEQEKRNKIILIGIIGLLVGLNIFLLGRNIWSHVDTSNIEEENITLTEQKSLLMQEVQEIREDLKYKLIQNSDLESLVSEKTKQLDSLVNIFNRRIEEKNYTIYGLQDELDLAQEKLQEFRENLEIDYLRVKDELARTQEENKALTNKIAENRHTYHKLEEKIKRVTALKLIKGKGQAIRLRKKREMRTSLTNKVEKFSYCFEIEKNQFADPGTDTFYLRIIDPQGNVLGKNTHKKTGFKLEDSEYRRDFSKEAIVYFDPESTHNNFCIEYAPEVSLTPGYYTFQIYHNGYLAGENRTKLKRGTNW